MQPEKQMMFTDAGSVSRNLVASTEIGMAHFAGTGPDGKRCKDCEQFWKERPPQHFTTPGKYTPECMADKFNKAFAGKEALTYATKRGYRRGTLCGKVVHAHRVAWKMEHGIEPNVIDHIDGDTSNNRIENLRNVSQSENMRNCKIGKANTTGVTGVHREEIWGYKYRAEIRGDGKRRISKRFKRLDSAIKWRREMEKEFGYIGRVA